MHVVAAPDKFRGTATASEVADAVAAACRARGATCDPRPMADGGEGLLEVLGGANRTSLVAGPLGEPVEAAWRLVDRTAVIEMAQASGLLLLGGPEANDPIAADTTGTGQLVREALELGARRVIVGLGGSATTDGGLGAMNAIGSRQRLRGVELLVACDVRTPFLEAAEVFGPQKGASRAQVRLLTNRLRRLADVYLEDHGVDVRELVGAGAAGGLAGGLAAVGGELADGFSLVAEEVGLDEALETADLVITGEGFLDQASFEGKVVGGVASMAGALGVPTVAIVGAEVGADIRSTASDAGVEEVLSLVELFGRERALEDTVSSVRDATDRVLAERS